MRWLVVLVLFAAVSVVQAQTHTVRAGQSLARIARRYRVSVQDLATANGLRAAALLRPGQTLEIPPRGVTYVRPGQTLAQIARESSCTVQELMRLNRLREGRLRAGQEIRLPGYEPPQSADREWGPPAEPGVITLRRREERARVRLIDEQGRVTREGLEALGRLMRAQDDDAIELPHPRLVRVLAAISDHFGGRDVTLVSGRRDARGFTRESSRHVIGHASDIRVAGVGNRALWDYCRSLAATGCGYYPRSTFVHVDVRDPHAQWVDWSAPGQRPRYGTLSRPWRRTRRGLDPRRERVSRSITRPEQVPLLVELTDSARQLVPVVPPLRPSSEDELEEEGEVVDESGTGNAEVDPEAPALDPDAPALDPSAEPT
ncbi:MAG: LysM peptidoglycan-binding domain-containing protein [Sandaracinaceae bacterium]|nr:LysM peptidoglycan-binding domain-containing protein [Sandaracinaceae bacterium]